MHVLMLADAVFEDIPGGSRVVARELMRGLAGRGHEVTFLVARHGPDAPADERHDGVRIVRYEGAGRAAAFVRAGTQAAARLWAAGGYDVVHTHFAYAALGPLMALPRGVPHVRSFYGPWNEEGWVEDTQGHIGPGKHLKALLKKKVRHTVEAANLRRSAATVVLSEHSRQEVLAFGYPSGRIRLIPGGADVERFHPAKDKSVVRERLGLPAERTLLLTVRRLAPRMGLDSLVRAMPAIIARRPDALLLVGGKGPERGRLERLVAELGLGDHVRLLGFIADAELAAHYQAADVFVLPTLALEGFGLVTAESLSCGTPVLGTPVGATPEILRRLDARLVLPGASPVALAEGITAFLEGGWRAELTPERLHGFVRANYTWDAHVRAVEHVYQEVIAE